MDRLGLGRAVSMEGIGAEEARVRDIGIIEVEDVEVGRVYVLLHGAGIR
jgi:hypothetical protein